MECNFYIGQKIVCINDDYEVPGYPINVGSPPWNILDGLTKGSIYTVRALRPSWLLGYLYPFICVLLYEIIREPIYNRLSDCEEEPGYIPARFKPLNSRKTDISIFTKTLKPVKENV